MKNEKVLLVGDNPFHGVSHLSQNRARERSRNITDSTYCANLVKTAVANGADGFMFSVSETTLNIIGELSRDNVSLKLYAIAPAASDYVRLASRLGTPGMAIHLAKQVIKSGNPKAIMSGFEGVVLQNPIGLMKAFLYYEICRIKSVSKPVNSLYCFMLHEIVTEMALALNLDWIFKAFVDFMISMKIKPGFETRNSPVLIDRLIQAGIDLSAIVIVAPYNDIGFQMSPSKAECEKALLNAVGAEVIAMSILASGYIKPEKAIEYVNSISGLKGVVVGVSSENHALNFKNFREAINK